MRTHAKWIWIVVFVAFVGGFLLYEVSGLAGRSGPTTSTVVASVNGRDIGYIQWVNASQQLAQQQEQQQTRGLTLDDGFIDLTRDNDNRARFYIKAGNQTVETSFGPKYPAAVVWLPNQNGNPQPFICFEPMTGVTNSMNLAHEGKYKELQSIAPGGVWKESYWVKPSGF